MKFKEAATRINGFSTPIFGVSWTPPQADVAVAERVLVVLEDRRALFSPYEAEVPGQCVASVLDIRKFLTDQLAAGGIAKNLQAHLQAMRAACRKLLDGVPPDLTHGLADAWMFNQALGELRGVFGVQIAQLAAAYGIDVPRELEPIVPLAPDTNVHVEEPVGSSIGRAIEQIRGEKGLSQGDLATAAGMKKSAVDALERGAREPKFSALVAIARGLGTSAAELVNRAEKDAST